MHVYLDAQPLLGARSGVSNYVRNLYENLLDLHLDVDLFFNRIAKNIHVNELPLKVHQEKISLTNSRYPYKVIRRLMKPNFLYEYPFDFYNQTFETIFHGTNFTHTPIKGNKTVITIHDLAYMIYPETTSEKIYKHHTKWVPYSAERATKIIAVSQHTKKDIMRLLGISEDKIEVIHLAADPCYKPLDKEFVQAAVNKYNLPENYILFVGTLEPRKNLMGLLKAFQYLLQNYECDHHLVIVGAKGWKYTPLFDFLQSNRLESKVIFTGFIEDEDLAAIYNGAKIFVMPSIYEGFGIPIIEAMNCGVPVIASNVSSIPEIVDKHGILLPPDEHELWATEIYGLLNNESKHAYYKQLSMERASHFSWRKTALETKLVYDKILNM
ncbi:D-inositol 3-phosphate glycosyltransferase [Paenibacillus konkukensis]|uniref:D-inositol 3-phosphate glycosyltransferase n=1 Tax=Paenibacillus konkukensis TaxID=2020716 RepID=A0ABY4RP92_9BACL|nr:glycosyltransferase family 1 protein [Paenibacillus konkukensis]UQZ83963.1 D-inositol 3-phosphate glycosyltransferase [Paenibacillus konkukensis]